MQKYYLFFVYQSLLTVFPLRCDFEIVLCRICADKKNRVLQLFVLQIAIRLLRRERDSNPWTANAVNGFRDRPVRPLRHLSEKTISFLHGYFHPFAFAKIQLIFQLLKFISIFYLVASISYCFSD